MHRAALQNLLELNGNVNSLVKALRAYPWDADAVLITLTRGHIRAALQIYLNHKLDAQQLEGWANAVECREDIDFEAGHENMLREVIFQLANPLLTIPITPQNARLLVAKLV